MSREPAPTRLASRRCLITCDLHLDGSARRESGLRRLLDECAVRRADLILLGDVFHFWFGRKQLRSPVHRRELDLLRRATARGCSITVVPGNRDFLLDGEFTQRSGVVVAAETASLVLGGVRIHLSHGDLFSTLDTRYQRMRRVLRSGMVVFLAHHLPAWLVGRFAAGLRRHSARVVRAKPPAVLEPDFELVERVIAAGHDAVVCGHFHRPRDVTLPPERGGGRLVVLEPYEERGHVLWADGDSWSSLWLEPKES